MMIGKNWLSLFIMFPYVLPRISIEELSKKLSINAFYL